MRKLNSEQLVTKGKCLCGCVEFEIYGDLPKIYQCHCSKCRKVSGSSSNSATLVHSTNFRWLKGEEDIRRYSAESGYKSEFCSKCGSPVPNKSIEETYWIPVGILNEPVRSEIVAHVFVNSRAEWDSCFIKSAVKKFPENPSLEEFKDLLFSENA